MWSVSPPKKFGQKKINVNVCLNSNMFCMSTKIPQANYMSFTNALCFLFISSFFPFIIQTLTVVEKSYSWSSSKTK